MSLKTSLLIGITVIGLAAGANQMLQPSSPEQMTRTRQEQAVDQAADADQKSKETMRDNADAHGRAEAERELLPNEPRPPEHPKIKIRVRP